MLNITLIRPAHAHSAYKIAAENFQVFAFKTAGANIDIITDLDPIPPATPLIVLGSDAVNHYAADLYFKCRTDGFKLRYCTDDYSIQSLTTDRDGNARQVLVIAGGRPRAAIYAVYRYFELFSGCRYFWDGDRLCEHELTLDGIDLAESPRFEYRGLRYFAHRSLHRFQAEHWSLDDWQREIDWVLKKRLNLFMLRIGLDDIYQKAFPETVAYPDRDKPLPEAGDGYDDRTLFWSLEYRGELRKKLLDYAFERDLMHPEDCGTMTHWYSRTPLDFLKEKNPSLLLQTAGGYREQTGLVWDIRDDENLNNYFKLTDTHVQEYGKPELFHTIGLAERNYSDDREENMRLKLYVYRRIATHLKEKYPNSPLLIASWDFWMFYTPQEVRRLVAELDPSQAILFDYTSDTTRESNFTNWGVVGKFPWIFGIFSGYEPNTEVRGYYELMNERIKTAKDDPFCKGVVLWPELSHGDTLIGEYLARNAWGKETLSVAETVECFCRDRYASGDYEVMSEVWRAFMPLVQLRAWSCDASFRQTGNDRFTLILNRARFDGSPESYSEFVMKAKELLASAIRILRSLAGVSEESDEFLRRDIVDIARTVLGRYVDFAIYSCQLMFAVKAPLELMSRQMNMTLSLMRLLSSLLASHEDFSMLATLEGMRRVAYVNPNFEPTLKRNAENGYCRSYIYENAEYLYIPEMELLFDEVKKAAVADTAPDRNAILERAAKVRENYFALPLAQMHREAPPVRDILTNAAELLEAIQF